MYKLLGYRADLMYYRFSLQTYMWHTSRLRTTTHRPYKCSLRAGIEPAVSRSISQSLSHYTNRAVNIMLWSVILWSVCTYVRTFPTYWPFCPGTFQTPPQLDSPGVLREAGSKQIAANKRRGSRDLYIHLPAPRECLIHGRIASCGINVSVT